MENIILSTDSYKASHYKQYPPGTEYVSSYIESRGGRQGHSLFFGLQMFLQKLTENYITHQDVLEAEELFKAHGVPFNREGWDYIVKTCGGYLPIRIQAVPEGTLVPTGNVLVQVVNTDPKVPWLTSYVETMLLRAVWYPTTVATNSYAAKQVIRAALATSSDAPEAELPFKMHDFGARGVSSQESAMIGGLAHLVNFKGTDTVEALIAAKRYYNSNCAGFSIPASEHSTITAWGKEREMDAYRNMLQQFGKPEALVACVSDSYDIHNATSNMWGGSLLDEVKESGVTIVVRPDSGDPVETPIEVIEALMRKTGHIINTKGYRVLPDYFRVIQGDGIDLDQIKLILDTMLERNLSASNIVFGQGGGLLQKVDRDTQQFAMKASAIRINEVWHDVYKDPVGDKAKRSKRGVLGLYKSERDGYVTFREGYSSDAENQLRTVYQNGTLHHVENLEVIRKRANG
jgi:nicotinamide phosphoribosyltransferase